MKLKVMLVAVISLAIVATIVYIDIMQRRHIRELATVRAEYEDVSKRADDLEDALGKAQISQEELAALVIRTANLSLNLQKSTAGLAKLTSDLVNLSTMNRDEITKIKKEVGRK